MMGCLFEAQNGMALVVWCRMWMQSKPQQLPSTSISTSKFLSKSTSTCTSRLDKFLNVQEWPCVEKDWSDVESVQHSKDQSSRDRLERWEPDQFKTLPNLYQTNTGSTTNQQNNNKSKIVLSKSLCLCAGKLYKLTDSHWNQKVRIHSKNTFYQIFRYVQVTHWCNISTKNRSTHK